VRSLFKKAGVYSAPAAAAADAPTA
jgi:hypothetical protein